MKEKLEQKLQQAAIKLHPDLIFFPEIEHGIWLTNSKLAGSNLTTELRLDVYFAQAYQANKSKLIDTKVKANAQPAYLWTNIWLTTLWKPIYLLLLADINFNRTINHNNIFQKVSSKEIEQGFLLEGVCFHNYKLLPISRKKNVNKIISIIKYYFPVIESLSNLKLGRAIRLVVDIILSAIYAIYHSKLNSYRDQSIEVASQYISLIQAATQINLSQPMPLVPDSKLSPCIQPFRRYQCCLNYLVSNDELCINCPKTARR